MAEDQAARKSEGGDKELYTLTEVSEKTGISMPTLQRYKKNYQDRIPAVGKGRTQRYPAESFEVFEQIKKENIKRRGRPPKKKKDTGADGGKAKGETKAKAKKKGRDGKELLTLTRIAELTEISYPTLSRYAKLHKDRIPYEGKGRKRRYHPEAVEVFKEIYAESPRGRKKKKKASKKSEKPAPKAAGAEKAPKAAAAGDGNLAQRVQALERTSSDLEKQIRELIKELKKPLKVTLKR